MYFNLDFLYRINQKAQMHHITNFKNKRMSSDIGEGKSCTNKHEVEGFLLISYDNRINGSL